MKPQNFPRVSLRKLTHEQLLILVRRIINEWSKKVDIPPSIVLLLADLTPLLDTIDKILLREQASAFTKAIREIDENRDRAYRILIRKIKGALMEFDQEIVDAGETLLPIISKFGTDITELSYGEQSTSTRLAVFEMRKPDNFLAITTLTLTLDLDRVEIYNDRLELKWSERVQDSSSKEDLPPLRLVRDEIVFYFSLLLKVTAYLHHKNHVSVDDLMYNGFEEELTKMGAIIKMRETISQKDEETA
jgi:hypothetical protein